MKIFRTGLIAYCLFLVSSCGGGNEPKFPTDKRYWDNRDYSAVIRMIDLETKPDQDPPRFNNPETRLIIEKLTDQENFNVVLDDKELGLNYRTEKSEIFFGNFQKMNKLYRGTDRTDKYLYEEELLKVYHFGLALQLKYFSLGNENIIAAADDPDAASIKSLTSSNIQVLIGNYNNYLDEINDEKAFSQTGHLLLSQGIDKYFSQVVEQYPDAGYDSMVRKAKLMEKKCSSGKIKASLNSLISLIRSKQAPGEEPEVPS